MVDKPLNKLVILRKHTSPVILREHTSPVILREHTSPVILREHSESQDPCFQNNGCCDFVQHDVIFD